MANTARPNILWYCTDQQRWDTIHALGNAFINTPNIDALCREGVAFQNAYCQSPICTPSRASFLTGRYPASNHVHRNGNEFFPPWETLVTKIMADAGYDCGLVGKLHLSRAQILESRIKNDGYRYFKWSHHPNPDYPEGHDYAEWLEKEKGVNPIDLYGKIPGSIGAGVPSELHQTTWCSEMAIRFINEDRNGPWLLSVNPFDPHPPFDPPKEYLDHYDPAMLPMPLFRESDIEHQKAFRDIDQQCRVSIDPRRAKESADTTKNVARGDLGSTAPTGYDPQFVKACYYAEVELIDAQLGRIIEALKKAGQYENTLIIFTSDHGELLGDHGLIYKGCRFYEGLTHVPLIISWPAGGIKGQASGALVELVDLAPTLLEAAGIGIPYNMQGLSLLPMITGQADISRHKPYVISEYHGAIGGKPMPDQTHGVMYFDGRYKVCVYQGHELGEIYDLEKDPGEFNDLWNEASFTAEKAELLHKAYSGYMSTSDAGIRRTHPY
ncbi:MAG: sulfatase-like hydrolase/transferase [Spirochaetia bacterium]|jgi:arylsulfatase A-like enzyme|nr:sulfatase-like hydrolase/transferase [Spirochaetia bacterium]